MEWDSDQGFTIKTPAKAAVSSCHPLARATFSHRSHILHCIQPTKKKRKTVHATKPAREPTPEPSDEEQQSFGARAAKVGVRSPCLLERGIHTCPAHSLESPSRQNL